MKKIKSYVVILLATFLSVPVFAAAPVNDVTATKNNMQLEQQLQTLTRLLETRNKMQVRLQAQLNELSQEMNQIRGSIELFNHKVEQIESRQRNLYQLIEEQSKSSVTAAPKTTAAVEDGQGDAKVAYQKAVDLVLVNKEYEQAITAFRAFVSAYPQSSYIANSYYWLGQLLYKEKKRDEARAAFLTVVEQHVDSSKRPDALYKIGVIDEYLGKIDSAKIFYSKLLKEYPESSAASLAKKHLQAL